MMMEVGFEPTRANTAELKSAPLDHSGTPSGPSGARTRDIGVHSSGVNPFHIKARRTSDL